MFLQTAPDTLSRWFYTNAPAAWISALIATAGLIFVLSSRKQPRRLVVREVRNTSLVTIWPSVRDQIQMTFDGRPIGSLGQVALEIYNEGSDVIQNARIAVSLPEDCKVLGLLIEPAELRATSATDKNVIYIILPYVNPYSDHKQTVSVSILVDGDPAALRTTGTGEGWSLRHSALPTGRQTRLRLRIGMVLVFAWLIATIPYGRFLERKFGISAYELSWRSLLSLVPSMIAFIVVMAVAGVFPGRAWRTKG
jgi:hypothetical protein